VVATAFDGREARSIVGVRARALASGSEFGFNGRKTWYIGCMVRIKQLDPDRVEISYSSFVLSGIGAMAWLFGLTNALTGLSLPILGSPGAQASGGESGPISLLFQVVGSVLMGALLMTCGMFLIFGSNSFVLDRKARRVTEMRGIWSRSPGSSMSLDQVRRVAANRVVKQSWMGSRKRVWFEVALVRDTGQSISLVGAASRADAEETARAVADFLGLETELLT